ncbi:triosephosphate isomerase [Caminicella sporogenes DSM 14501]|uniref:Triosephosphate isomerase n=1 Tax=Caminicella sporogenes DSM 14501 TaxID=1121266 RepID=A0A1M6ML01_9FIRM|nr:triose-phosphate isomerase [Caminicella sporogenes]RKD27502.1 triose-phosphate isomerase [Caminicella sporogenes]WIF94925.1 triose-phosphate isomerase [Caminicella sporogenes]SHJ84175.1 triosephosphate isomerase [Caminicella sporogenes DSM 14501]
MRVPIIAANWKMHMTVSEAKEFVEEFKGKIEGTDVEVVICPPFTLLNTLKEITNGTKIKIGAQNMHWEEKGAFTGEISPIMLKDLNIDYCIIGHSERRQYFSETDEIVNKKVKSALAHDIKPILCVGETLDERKAEKTEEVVKKQVLAAFKDVDRELAKEIVIAYEPIWAIGTGLTASPEDANKVIAFIRETIKELYGEDISEEIRIQYGGSVKPNNVEDIMNMEDIDGALVGGASLKAESFAQIVNF